MSENNKKTILITGAAGFLGNYLAKHLADLGHAVVATARQPAPEGLHQDIEWVTWDCLGDAPSTLRGDVVIDCAAAQPSLVPRAADMLEANIRLARIATEAAARSRAATLICCSSLSVYGRPDVDSITDQTPTLPNQAYGLSKLAAEAIWGEAVDNGEVAGQISMRLPAVLGARSRYNFPSTFAEKLAAGEPVQVFNPDGLYNTCIHAADVAAFVTHLIDNPPVGKFAGTIAAEEPMPMLQAVRTIAEAMGRPFEPEIKPANMRATTITNGVMLTLGYRPSSTRETLARFGRDRAA